MSKKDEIKQMKVNPDYFVVMSNDLVRSCTNLSLNATKLLRLVISQCKLEDDKFESFVLSIKDFAKALDISEKNLYRDIQDICVALLKEIVLIGDGNPRHPWVAHQWVAKCSYDNGLITIKLHDDLAKHLINLRGNYTQYEISRILWMKSVYSIRLYELLRMKATNFDKTIANMGVVRVYLTISDIKKATMTETKYRQVNDFYKNVIAHSIEEFNKIDWMFEFSCSSVKEGKSIVGYNFEIRSVVNGHKEKKEALKEFMSHYAPLKSEALGVVLPDNKDE